MIPRAQNMLLQLPSSSVSVWQHASVLLTKVRSPAAKSCEWDRFIYFCLFNDAVNSSDYIIVLNDKLINEVDGI
jgi:hypothetical protein